MQETVNVWEDVKVLVDKKYGDRNDEFINTLKALINARLSWLKGTFVDGESNERKKKYIRNYETISQFFSKKALNYGLSKVILKDFMTTQFAYGGTIDFLKKKGYEVKETNVRKTVTKTYQNGREYEEIVTGDVFYVPDSYQIHEKDFIKDCMFYDYPYMKKYEKGLRIYKMEDFCEFYIECEDGVLYIPYECLKKKTIEPAVKRMTEYFKSYYGKKASERLKIMEGKTFQMLKRDVEGK